MVKGQKTIKCQYIFRSQTFFGIVILVDKFNCGRLAQLVDRRSAEREVAGSIRGRTNTQGFKITEDKGATFGLQTVRPSG